MYYVVHIHISPDTPMFSIFFSNQDIMNDRILSCLITLNFWKRPECCSWMLCPISLIVSLGCSLICPWSSAFPLNWKRGLKLGHEFQENPIVSDLKSYGPVKVVTALSLYWMVCSIERWEVTPSCWFHQSILFPNNLSPNGLEFCHRILNISLVLSFTVNAFP